jgi:hypothetical protein
VVDLSERRMKEHLMQEVAFRRKKQVTSIHRVAEERFSRKPMSKSMLEPGRRGGFPRAFEGEGKVSHPLALERL